MQPGLSPIDYADLRRAFSYPINRVLLSLFIKDLTPWVLS